MSKWLIFTDLDGTLLDHHDYNFASALPALEKIRKLRIPLIINSSKTYAEIESIMLDLHNNGAFVVENGAAIFFPPGLFTDYEQSVNTVMLGRPIEDILATLHSLRGRYGFAFKGFSDFSVDEVMTETGLTEIEAERAKRRLASEPVKWLGNESERQRFEKLLRAEGLRLVKGGRFWHVMGGNDKAEAMAWLLNQYTKERSCRYSTIALGDSQNDRKMLELADYAAVIPRADGSFLEIDKSPEKLVRGKHPAPLGWLEAVEQLFSKLKIGDMNE